MTIRQAETTESTEFSTRSVRQVVEEQSRRVLDTYRIDPGLVQEHANGERRINQGGYGERQIYELVQNGADEMRGQVSGEIKVILTDTHLYCANTGRPMTPEGADTILRMSVSRKRGGQIGRFGVGVKSVLSVSDAPEFFSTTGSFGFDREWSAEAIRTTAPNVAETPVLRMARVIDTAHMRKLDPVLDELMTWAVTVVRLPLTHGAAGRLGADLNDFPSEFQLFSPHVASLILEDRRIDRPMNRELFVKATGPLHTLQSFGADGKQVTEEWHVFRRTYTPSAAALRSAGELHDRPEIDIAWAVPRRGHGERGTFWAYFPTNYATTLRGLLNAPWKTSEDRQNLFDHNSFNDELIEQAAVLVLESLPSLIDAADPGSFLVLLPGRGREAPQWADRGLTDAIWAAAASHPSLPDQNGDLRLPSELQIPPENLWDEWLSLWSDYPGRPDAWTHKSVEQRERRAKAKLIFDRAERPEATVREWLEALVSDGSAEASAHAVQIVAGMVQHNHAEAEKARAARILRTETSGFIAANTANVFCRSDDDALADDLIYVDRRVVEVIGVRSALELLGVRAANPAGRLASVLERGFAGYDNSAWDDFWRLCRRITPHDAAAEIRMRLPQWRSLLQVRTVKGCYQSPVGCLLPGRVVPQDGSRDAEFTVDLKEHAADRPLLEALGMSDVPVAGLGPHGDSWFEEYRHGSWEMMCSVLPVGVPRPKFENTVVEGANPPGPLGLLRSLSEEGKYQFIRHLPTTALVRDWTARANRQTQQAQVDSPLVWMARRYGFVRTSIGLVPVDLAVGPALAEHKDVLAVAEVDRAISDTLKLPTAVEQIPDSLWRGLVEMVSATEVDAVPGHVYALVLRSGTDWPGGETRCRVGGRWATRPDNQICATSHLNEYDSLRFESIPALLVPTQSDVDSMIEQWGMRRYGEMIAKELRKVEDAEPVLVTDEFPHLRVLRGQTADGWYVVPCSELDQTTRSPHGMYSTELQTASRDRTVYVRRPANDTAVLNAVSDELGLRLSWEEIATILTRREAAKGQGKLRMVRDTQDIPTKMLLLIGAERLRRGLPEGIVTWEEQGASEPISEQRIAELALHAHGDGILRHHRKDLELNFEALSRTYTGDTSSLRTVSDLGLPPAFGGVKEESPPPTEHVSGPTPHFPLHDYQETLAGRMHRLLMLEKPERAMLSLPTGAGKTRVAAEAVIRYIKEQGPRCLGQPMLWIAQSEELCEQAVQSWRYVWEKVGPGQTRLTISRFWGSRETAQVTENPHLVVATDDKLTANIDDPSYAWMCRPALVIVDEAHGSIGPSYTRLLEKLGLPHNRTTRPLIGLTATPFRGRNEAETSRLVARYGKARLDDRLFEGDPYEVLQKIGVLAHVDHMVLDGSDLELTADELSQVRGGSLPAAAEQRLAVDHSRNAALLGAIMQLPQDWPVLLFATSVNHARFMATLLNDRGIASSFVDAQTPLPRRRQIVDRFRTGRIRVLTNYGVLHQGFDAPATRAVVVARPTYSPNVYQQMIGRGLRGPANGGKERCLILNVRDNIVNYGEALAFTGFEHLWSSS